MEEENIFLYIDFEFRIFKESRSETIFGFLHNIAMFYQSAFLLISTVHGTLAGPKNLHSYRGINVSLYKPVGAKQVKN